MRKTKRDADLSRQREESLWRGLELKSSSCGVVQFHLALSDGQMRDIRRLWVLFTANRRPVGGELGLGQLRCDTSERATSRVL
jgi:hypothetical protein